MKSWLLIVPVIAVVSCGPEAERSSDAKFPAPVEEKKPEVTIDVNDADLLVGEVFEMVEPILKEAEIQYRVVERDGETFPVTMDFMPERLNFKIKDGVITAVTKG